MVNSLRGVIQRAKWMKWIWIFQNLVHNFVAAKEKTHAISHQSDA